MTNEAQQFFYETINAAWGRKALEELIRELKDRRTEQLMSQVERSQFHDAAMTRGRLAEIDDLLHHFEAAGAKYQPPQIAG